MLRSLALAATTVLLGTTAACGGGSTDEAGGGTQQYCAALRSAQKEFGAINSGDITPANLTRILDRMHTLAEQAPPAVADEWQQLDGAISRLQSGLDDLGLSFQDLSDPRKLAQVDPQKLQRFGRQLQQLSGKQFDEAGRTIEQHAKRVCHLNLSQQ